VTSPDAPQARRPWDCHVHVFGPPARYPFAADRTYTPNSAWLDALAGHRRRIGAGQLVLVQASPYGTDNRCLLDALTALAGTARGVVIPATDVAPADLQTMRELGVRGIRLHEAVLPAQGFASAAGAHRHFAAVADELGLHFELNALTFQPDPIARMLDQGDAPIVLDHFAALDPGAEDFARAFDRLRRLLDTGRVWVKFSGAYRLSTRSAEAVAGLTRDLFAAAPGRCVWGSDWPHTPERDVAGFRVDDVTAFQPIDSPRLLADVAAALPDDLARRALLVDNPGRLYR
jgi:predicted TIM-barrel fold metal-dependent hydrolase